MAREYHTCTTAGCETQYPASKRRRTTLCKSCQAREIGSSPEKAEKCRAKMRAHFSDPDYANEHRQRTGAGTRARMADPAFAERRRELGRACGLKRLGHINRPAGSESRVVAGQRRRATLLAWCPVEYRGEYERLKTKFTLRAPEARQMIEQQIRADGHRYARTGQLQSGNLSQPSFTNGER